MKKRAIQQAASRAKAYAIDKGIAYVYLRGTVVCLRSDDRVMPGELVGVYTAAASVHNISCDIEFVAGRIGV